ncbi:extracellular solute-binding protein [Caldicoprobacter faecalis]|uniref:Putative aldouronate transport system substrate-binding protein n=1 Tax=Caldicoprobacter faecalis TaxID=937334 RepID=A0A1I5SVA1_9FIRM|nr:extracellular solute-binding protein [Caldicoprobacter faecalis]SFP74673.1 putative aldouronate transport system substrate-binding protein [Caldicoprobacter faecalis]
MSKMRILSVILVLVLCFVLFAGCGSREADTGSDTTTEPKDSTSTDTEQSKDQQSQQEDSEDSGDAESVYPIKGDYKLTYWVELAANVTAYCTNYSELPWRQELEKRTGVKVEYIHPPVGQAEESLNVLLASGEYPDIMVYQWPSYPGGVMKLYNDGVIIELTDLMKKYAPNLMAYYEANPEVARQVKSDDGKFYLVPFIRGHKELRHTSGPVLRADWLKANGHDVPITIADWEKVLTAFKENQGCEAPFTGNLDQIRMTFVNAFGIDRTFYPDNKVVKFGPVEDGYKEFLITMADWYKKGLIDQNFSTVDRTIQDSKMTTGRAGATRAAGGGQMGPYINTARKENPEYDLVAAPYPVKNPGEKPKYMNSFEFTSNGHAVITTSCKHPDIAMRFLDYAYSEEGHILYNYGIEGVSFEYVNGVPTYTDLIMNNPEGLTIAQAMSKYCLAPINGPFIQDVNYIRQYYTMPQQKDALVKWSDVDENTSVMPPITFTPEESAEVAKIMNEINTYVDEMTMKIIMGTEPVSKVDEFQKTIKDMGIDKAIEIYQRALDRYYAR